MNDVLTIGVSILGGSVGGGLLGWWQAAGVRRTTRRGRARLVHEDLYRLQSTVARMYFQRRHEDVWGEQAWMLKPLASTEDQQDVLAYLGKNRFGACAGALGWAEYLRSGHDPSPAPSDAELELMYEHFAWGRAAISKMKFSGLEYIAHVAGRVVDQDKKTRNKDRRLPVIKKAIANQAVETYRSRGETVRKADGDPISEKQTRAPGA